jgi:flagellar biosynthesis/type III secretory pathway protein FliH
MARRRRTRDDLDTPSKDAPQRFLTLYRLIDSIMPLPQDLEEAFRADMFAYEKEKKMPYLSSIERDALQRGIEQGLEQGVKKGLTEGIDLALHAKFGRQGQKLMSKVRALGDLAKLRQFAPFLKTVKTVNEVREFLS